MKFGKILIIGGLLAGFATPMFADQIYGEFDASGQGTISTKGSGSHIVATGLTFGGTIGTTKGNNVRPTGTVTQDGSGVPFGKQNEAPAEHRYLGDWNGIALVSRRRAGSDPSLDALASGLQVALKPRFSIPVQYVPDMPDDHIRIIISQLH